MLLLVLPALVFALITWQVAADGPLLRLDADASRALVHPDRFSDLLSDLGNVQVAVPALAVALGYTAWRGRSAGTRRWWLPPLAAAVLMALVPAIVVPLKEWTARPGTPVVPPGTGYFPVRPHGDRGGRVRLRGPAPPPLLRSPRRPPHPGGRLRAPRPRCVVRPGPPRLALAAGRGGQLVPEHHPAGRPVPRGQPKYASKVFWNSQFA